MLNVRGQIMMGKKFMLKFYLLTLQKYILKLNAITF